jgi:hypothetical protein
MFWRREKKSYVVNAEQLAALIRFLHENAPGLYTISQGVTVRVFAQSNGDFVVYLDAEQTALVREKLAKEEIFKGLENW